MEPTEEEKKEEEKAKLAEEAKQETKEEAKAGDEEGEEKEQEQGPRNNHLTLFKEGNPEQWEKVKAFYDFKDSVLEYYSLNTYKRRVLNLNKELVRFIKESEEEKLRIVNIGQLALERIKDKECPTPVRRYFLSRFC